MLKSAVHFLRQEGLTYDEIATKLNKEGYRNSRGNKINKMLAIRLYKKYKEEEELNV